MQLIKRYEDSFKQAFSRNMTSIFLLAFASGLPFALSGATLQAWYTVAGISTVQIGMMGLVGLPYTFKFLWAPLLDRFVPPWLGRRRGWMLITQVGLTLCLLFMAMFSPQHEPSILALLAVMLAFLSATQDIAIDAYRADILQPEQRGMGAALTVTGYRIALIVAGAFALKWAANHGFQNTYLLMAALMFVCIFFSLFSPNIAREVQAPKTLQSAVMEPFKEFISRKNALIFLGLIVTYKLGDAFANSLSTTFLLRGVNFSLEDVAVMNKLVGILSTIAGAFVGGIILTRINLYHGLLYFGVVQALSNFMFMVLAMVGKVYWVMALAVFSENFCGGLGTAAFFAMLMSLCDKRYTAAQYALFSALFGAARVFVSPISGIMVEHLGWVPFYYFTVLISFPGLILVMRLRKNLSDLK